MTRPDTATKQAVFGGFDGLVSLLGVLAGLSVAHAHPATVLAVCAGLAIASAVGMAAGDWLAGTSTRMAVVMGAATLTGSFLPALPAALIPSPAGQATTLAVVLAVGVAISEVRARATKRRLPAYLSTALILVVASGLSIGASVLFGAVG